MLIYFKYKLKNVIGYNRIVQKSNIKFLEKCNVDGYNHMFTNNGYVYFNIDNKIYRLLKLSYLDNKSMEYKMRSLDLIIKSSIRTEKSDIPEEIWSYSTNGSYWFRADTWYDYEEEENRIMKSEYKERIRNHNRHYKQKYKLKK